MQKSEGSKGEVATMYFQNLFKFTNPDPFQDIFQGFLPRINQTMNEQLIKRVTREEVREAVFSIKHANASGPNGMTGLFYQKYWDIVGN